MRDKDREQPSLQHESSDQVKHTEFNAIGLEDSDEDCNLDYEDLNENTTEMDEQITVNICYLSPYTDTSIKCLSSDEILDGFK